MKKTLTNIKGIDLICKQYLEPNNIPYEAYTIDDEVNNHLDFEDISMLIDTDYVLAYCTIAGIVCKDEVCLKQVKEYLHRCNYENGLVWFDLYESNNKELNITCGFNTFFEEKNIKAVLLDGILEIKRMKNTYALGIKEVAQGAGNARDIFSKYCVIDTIKRNKN